MLFVVVAFAVFMIVLGGLGLVAPGRMPGFARRWQAPGALWLAAGLRVVLGVALWLVAPQSRAPLAFQAFGVLAVLAGLAVPLVGREGANQLIEWWAGQPAGFIRAWCLVVFAIGALLLYGVAA